MDERDYKAMNKDSQVIIEYYPPHILTFEDFTIEGYQKIIYDINESKDFINRELYLSSSGGFTRFISPIKNIIESSNIKVIANDHIHSSAFMLFFATNTEREVLDDTVGMFHYPYLSEVSLLPNNSIRLDGNDKLSKLNTEFRLPFQEYFNELLGITKKVHNRLLKGDDLVYRTEDLRKLLAKSEKIFGRLKNNA